MNIKKYWSMRRFEPRQAQIDILTDFYENKDSYENIIIEAGTGIGKSAIATTISNMMGKSYILTRTIQLQEQYLRDFDYMCKSLKGASNFDCLINTGLMCDECLNQRKCEICRYKMARTEALNSNCTVFNYAFFYNFLNSKSCKIRRALIFDEAHKLEQFMLGVNEFKISDYYMRKDYGIDIFEPVRNGQDLKVLDSLDYWKKKITEIYNSISKDFSAVETQKEELENTVNVNVEYAKKVFKRFNRLKRQKIQYESLIRKLNDIEVVFIYPNKNQIMGRSRKLEVLMKPIRLIKEDYTPLYDKGGLKVFMSGTMGNMSSFMRYNKISADDTYIIQRSNQFPVENRPIIKRFVGDLRGQKKRVPNWQTLHVLQEIRNIILENKDMKGIIHTTSHTQTNWIINALEEDYPIFNAVTTDESSREEVIQEFKDFNDGTALLIGAGIKDGVDFPDDYCRFQILAKAPIPRFDKQIYRRNQVDSEWVPYQTIMDMVQAYGRGIRHENDYCRFYILDKYVDTLIHENTGLFTVEFLEAYKNSKK